jgi:lysophospholipase L1-like esterase
VIAVSPDVIVVSFGLNDMRGALTPGSAGNPLGGNYPAWRVAYGAQGQKDMALVMQYWMQQVVTRTRATLPDCAIIFRMPNALTTDCAYMLNSITPQQTMDVLRLAYRGDPSLSVPSPETLGTGVLVLDAMATIYGPSAYPSTQELIANPSDGLHPSGVAYRELLYLIGKVIAGPSKASIDSDETAARYAAQEKAIVGGWQGGKESVNVLTRSGEYEQVYTCTVSTNSASFFDMGLGPTDVSPQHAWGGNLNDPQGALNPPGLAIGDIIVWQLAGVPTIRIVSDTGNGLPAGYIRWYSGVDIHSATLPSDLAAGTQGIVYRHKFAQSIVARRNLDRLQGTPEQVQSAYSAVYPFVVTSAANGSFTAKGIGGEAPFQNRTASDHVWSTADLLGLSGIEGKSNAASFDAYFGLPLTGATFSQSGQSVTVTLAGVDFTKAVGQQGVLLTRDNAGSLTVDQVNGLSSIRYPSYLSS